MHLIIVSDALVEPVLSTEEPLDSKVSGDGEETTHIRVKPAGEIDWEG